MSITFLFACHSLPPIHPGLNSGEMSFACADPFVKHPHRFVHAIETRMPGDIRSTVIGIAIVDPARRFISCAIITAEGMVLLEAESSESQTIIHRALPPFDSTSVSQNMLKDIKLIFLSPQGQLYQKGYLSGESKACRYREENGDWVDIEENRDNKTLITYYISSGALKRQVVLDNKEANPYGNIVLQAKDYFDYFLIMNLIDAQPIREP